MGLLSYEISFVEATALFYAEGKSQAETLSFPFDATREPEHSRKM